MSSLTIPEKVLVWNFGGKPGNLRSQNNYADNGGYNMLCRGNNKFLTWKTVPLGINLDYVSDAGVKKTHFALPDKQEREILTGEPIALGIGKGEAYLRYAHRTIGINLEWSQNPVYEWRIFDSSAEKGKPIATDSWVAIVNDKVEPSADFLVYLDRDPMGVADIGWTTSPDFWEGVFDATAEAAVRALKRAIL
jgi:hypothetical protein